MLYTTALTLGAGKFQRVSNGEKKAKVNAGLTLLSLFTLCSNFGSAISFFCGRATTQTNRAVHANCFLSAGMRLKQPIAPLGVYPIRSLPY
jgi:hypothetical protein